MNPVVVLVVGAGAAWESDALRRFDGRRDVVVLKRCVDVDDLLAAASARQADVAVVGIDAPGLDAAAVDHLRRDGVQPVAVVPADAVDAGRLRASRIGIPGVVDEAALHLLPDAVLAVVAAPDAPPTMPRHAPSGRPDAAVPADDLDLDSGLGPGERRPRGRTIVVWGPAGAPGRTTLAAAVAAELARRRRRTILVDADPYGGTVAQQLGILDEVSGLLSAARLATAGTLAAGFTSVQRGLDQHLSVVTGLPRADRWAEVRAGALEHLLEVGRDHGDVVVDTGFSLEEDGLDPGRPGRNRLTLEALGSADELLVVGTADPVGLSRLARALVELTELTGGAPVRVVVNRMRPSLGWSERDVSGMVAGFGRIASLHFVPDDRAGVDRAVVAGRTLVESGDSAVTRAVAAVVDALQPPQPPQPPPTDAQSAGSGGAVGRPAGSRGLRRRTAGRGRRR
ncbi:chromosome partitioning protein [Nocardioides sp. zg-579]|uniref:Chromosome partitioning protein n=1 Tax=Nocardioides marmotae TaxID=2663857 RepID=A0A6I3IYY6_9ACTN|nr:chromosome partitioning protein [Nocardioides marmotae]MCR6030651.1 chromosome partitioning protein [Gordonia jinghuaiqii]MTB94287.1 chromosome partitioning protein [Nocardioides marmotae]QKE00562.1 chromosome partitioning protein [Nocardioides marmotae]